MKDWKRREPRKYLGLATVTKTQKTPGYAFRLEEWQPKKSAYFQVFSTSGSELLSRFELFSNSWTQDACFGKKLLVRARKVQEFLAQIPTKGKTEV